MGIQTEKIWEIEPRELAGIFAAHEWSYSYAPQPTASDIERMVDSVVTALRTRGHTYAELGRFVVFRDADFPNGFEVALKVGYYRDEPVALDEADVEQP